MERLYKLDEASYEKFKNATKEEVNILLSNVYSDGYNTCLAEKQKEIVQEEKFTYKMACKITDKLRQEKIKGIGKTSIDKIATVIESYVGKL